MANTKLLEYLRLLLPSSEEGVYLLASYFENKRLQKGDCVLRAGEMCRSFYFVESGHLRTYYNKDGVEINIHFHLEGSITSDHKNAKAGIPSQFTIEAGEKSEIWVLDRNTLAELYHTHSEIRPFGKRLVIQLLLDLSIHSNLFRIYSPTERYQYIETHNPELLQRISLSNLASYLGMNRRTLTRIRKKK